jgi:hypothetical protein
MTTASLTFLLAERVMGWRYAPDRFLLGNRQWIRLSQFQPLAEIQDAFRVLEKVATSFSLIKSGQGQFTASVWVGDRTGCASGKPEAATITLAVARAIGINAPGLPEDYSPAQSWPTSDRKGQL